MSATSKTKPHQDVLKKLRIYEFESKQYIITQDVMKNNILHCSICYVLCGGTYTLWFIKHSTWYICSYCLELISVLKDIILLVTGDKPKDKEPCMMNLLILSTTTKPILWDNISNWTKVRTTRDRLRKCSGSL